MYIMLYYREGFLGKLSHARLDHFIQYQSGPSAQGHQAERMGSPDQMGLDVSFFILPSTQEVFLNEGGMLRGIWQARQCA